jgi:hypothetical protein
LRRLLLALLVQALGATAAFAHTPYLLPNAFDAERPRVTIQGALTEDDYFNPDIALNLPGLMVTGPTGETSELKPAAVLTDVTVFEAPLDQPGAYRFSTGQRVGRQSTFAKVGDQWLQIRTAQQRPGADPREGGGGPPRMTPPPGEGPPNSIAEADVPAGAPTAASAQVMVVETYVSRGAPTETALKTSGQGFELKPLTHPNAIYVDQGFDFQLLVDGQPAAGAAVRVYRAGNVYDDRRIAAELRTDAAGRGQVAFTQPGVYLLTTQYPAGRRGPTEPPPARSYTYSLTFEVTR